MISKFGAEPLSRRRCLSALAVSASATLGVRDGAADSPERGPKVSPPTLRIEREIPVAMPFGVEADGARLWITSITDQAIYRWQNQQLTPLVTASAGLNWPHEVRVLPGGDLIVADTRNDRVVRVGVDSAEVIEIAKEESFDQPHSVDVLDDDHVLIADTKNHRICKLHLQTDAVSLFCGDGRKQLPDDGDDIDVASLFGPRAMAIHDDVVVIALREGNSIWKADLRRRKLRHVAGTGVKGYQGDGLTADQALLNGPKGIVVDREGSAYVVDTENHCVRWVHHQGIQIETALGGRIAPSTTVLKRPHGIAISDDGRTLWLADSENDRVLQMSIG